MLNLKTFIQMLNEEGITYYDWNVSAGDAQSVYSSRDQIVQRVVSNVAVMQDSIVLMHDANDKGATVEALPIIIEKIQEMEDSMTYGQNAFMMGGRMTTATANAMETAAGNSAGAMTGFMGMGMAGGVMGGGFGAAQQFYAMGQQQAAQKDAQKLLHIQHLRDSHLYVCIHIKCNDNDHIDDGKHDGNDGRDQSADTGSLSGLGLGVLPHDPHDQTGNGNTATQRAPPEAALIRSVGGRSGSLCSTAAGAYSSTLFYVTSTVIAKCHDFYPPFYLI